MAGVVLFAVMATLASTHDHFTGDVWIVDRIQSLRWSPAGTVLDWTSDLAVLPWMGLIIAIASIFLLWRAGPIAAMAMLSTIYLRAFVWSAKDAVERPRPTADLVDVRNHLSSFSFPSGHSFNAMLVFGMILYFATVYVSSARLRLALQVSCVWVILATGLQRMYFGYHWPSDVLGGFLGAGLVIGALIGIHQLSLQSPRLRDWGRLGALSAIHPRTHGNRKETA